jgi:hypothetical protein
MPYNHFKSPKRFQSIPTLIENPVLKQSPPPCEQVVDCDSAVYSNITSLMRSNAPWHEIERAGMEAQPVAVPRHASYIVSKIRDTDGRTDFLAQRLKTTSMEARPSVGTSRLDPVLGRLDARRAGHMLDEAPASHFPAL